MTLTFLLRGRAPGNPGPAQRRAGPEFAPDVLATEVGTAIADLQLATSKEKACA